MPSPRTFHLQEHHIQLAWRMRVAWQDCETGAPEIDPKRPYGNSFVPRDVAEIIGEKWPDEDELSASAYEREVGHLSERMMVIHREMETALQVILGHAGAQVEPGHYRNVAEAHCAPKWVRS